MKVYVVTHGEKHEGGTVDSVHSSIKSAVKKALSIECHFEGGWNRIDKNIWENGCDFVSVEKFQVVNPELLSEKGV